MRAPHQQHNDKHRSLVMGAFEVALVIDFQNLLNQGFSHPLPAGKKMPAEPPKNARQALKENVLL